MSSSVAETGSRDLLKPDEDSEGQSVLVGEREGRKKKRRSAVAVRETRRSAGTRIPLEEAAIRGELCMSFQAHEPNWKTG